MKVFAYTMLGLMLTGSLIGCGEQAAPPAADPPAAEMPADPAAEGSGTAEEGSGTSEEDAPAEEAAE